MRIKFTHTFEDIVSLDNLLEAWKEFIKGKIGKPDVQEFSSRLMDNIILLHKELLSKTYEHGGYKAFNICDPKPRNIHKATVRDRLLRHAIYRKLYPFFDKTFISDSYSCRIRKGVHKAIIRFKKIAYKISQNNTKTCWILKCDVRKFFANINHEVLIAILKEYIPDKDIIWLLKNVIESFYSTEYGVGLPLGNLTSQLFVNIYMNEFDQFVKHKLKAKYYIRYADDFVILSGSKIWLEGLIEPIQKILKDKMRLELHPEKIHIKTLASGLDFLGWIHFLDYRVLRTTTKRKMLKKMRCKANELKFGGIAEESFIQTINSYFGLLKHGNSYKIKNKAINEIFDAY